MVGVQKEGNAHKGGKKMGPSSSHTDGSLFPGGKGNELTMKGGKQRGGRGKGKKKKRKVLVLVAKKEKERKV